MDNEIIIVSGLPRSGTSLMMQMLDNGGVPVVTDHIRTADTDNPRGYYEFERVKKIKDDVSWLPETRGKAFKMVSQLLYELPANETYRVIFMERDLDEMIRSQEKMLARLNKPSAPRAAIERAFREHLRRVRAWLAGQPNIEVLYRQLQRSRGTAARRSRARQCLPRGQGKRREHVKDRGPGALPEPEDCDRSFQRTGHRQ